MGEQPPGPRVTISDPAAPTVDGPDLLVSGDERRAALDPVGRRRLLVGGTLLTAIAVVAATTLTVLERREAADRELRLAQVVSLALQGVESTAAQTGGDVGDLRFRLSLQVSVRNDGPREVALTGAGLGPYRARGGPSIAAGATQVVPLERMVVCPQAPQVPPVESVPDAVEVSVQTGAGVRQAALPLSDGLAEQIAEQVRQACGVLPLSQSLVLVPVGVELRGDVVVVQLEAGNASTQPLRLVQAVVQQGLRSVLRDATGAELDLPLELAATPLGRPPSTVPLEVQLSVVSCREIYRLTPAPPEQPSLDTLLVTLDDGGGEPVGPIEVDLLAPVLREVSIELC
jgi:hypothetical protein